MSILDTPLLDLAIQIHCAKIVIADARGLGAPDPAQSVRDALAFAKAFVSIDSTLTHRLLCSS